MKKLVAIIMVLILLSGCDYKVKTIYEYKGIRITRLTRCGKSIFYYGEASKDNKNRMEVIHTGINAMFKGYLVFKSNDVVYIINSAVKDKRGNNVNNKNKLRDTLLPWFEVPETDSICVISYPLYFEQDENRKNKTKVNIIYDLP